MTQVRIEQFLDYPVESESAVVLKGIRVFPMPLPEKLVLLRVGDEEVELTREGALEVAAALREAVTDG